jgi:hypothetical protein
VTKLGLEMSRTILHEAAARGDVDSVRSALSTLPVINLEAVTQGYEETALHLASANGHARVVEELLSAGAAANTRRAGGFTALHLSANTAVAEQLLCFGADQGARSSEGRTAAEHCLGGETVQAYLKQTIAARLARPGLGARIGARTHATSAEQYQIITRVRPSICIPEPEPEPEPRRNVPLARPRMPSGELTRSSSNKSVTFSPDPPTVQPIHLSDEERQSRKCVTTFLTTCTRT